MDIEEYRPVPPRLSAAPPRRKSRATAVTILLFVGTFFGTIAFEERREIAGYARQHFGGSVAPKAQQLSESATAEAPPLSEQDSGSNVGRAMACIPANVLSASEIAELNAAIAALPPSPTTAAPMALSAESFDPHKMTGEQAREMLQLLAQVRGPIGDKALQAFNQSVSEGACKINPDNAAKGGSTTPPPHAPAQAAAG